MKEKPLIITVGLAPAWDITCLGRELDWGRHQVIDEQTTFPAGKAFNISRALAWMGQANIAAGLWGESDFRKMHSLSRAMWPLIDVKMTLVEGQTRQNVTVVDTSRQKEMHLRIRNDLCSKEALEHLKSDLEHIVKEDCICVFSGAMPEENNLRSVVEIVKQCTDAGARIVLDTHSRALQRLVDTGLVWLLKPNIAEFRELCDQSIEDDCDSLVQGAGSLLHEVENVLISRGKEGAILVNNHGAWSCRALQDRQVLGTVGCGDYLLAGFLKDWIDKATEDSALSTAVTVAAAKAWGWTQVKTVSEVMENVQVELSLLK